MTNAHTATRQQALTDGSAKEESIFTRVKVQIVAAIFLQRIGANVAIGGSTFPFPVSLFLTPLVTFWNIVTGAAQLSMPRFALYTAFVAVMMFSTILNSGGFSTMSMFLVAGIYAMFLFPIQLEDKAYIRFFRLLANVATFICLLGVAQYLIQYVWSPEWLFSWRTVVPKSFLIEYNTLNETRYGSHIFKANGFFLMEASFQSQLAARVLLICIFVLKDFRYAIPLGIGMLTTYSGTGMILFAIFGLVPMLYLFMRHSRFRALLPVGLLLLPLAVAFLWDRLDFGLFIERLGEFSNPRSSAYARFVTSQIMLDIFSNSNLLKLLVGAGPGASEFYSRGVSTSGETFASTWIKLILEYGLIGFSIFLAFFFTCVRETLRSNWLALAFTFHFFFLDGGFAAPQQALMTMLLGAYVCLKATNAGAGPATPMTGFQAAFGRRT
jgi:hypothetical protein